MDIIIIIIITIIIIIMIIVIIIIIIEAIRREFPELYNFAHATYNGAPVLQFGEFIILSAEGPQQGDPFSSVEFCLAIHPLLRGLISELKVCNLDDVTLSGPFRLF